MSHASDSEDGDVEVKEHQDSKPFACPFYRMDPVLHVDCISRKLNRIHDVKQHLNRRHSLEFSCSLCWEWFPSSRLLQKHIQSRPCERRDAPNDLEYMSSVAQDRLALRADRTKEGKEQWYMIWDILFDGYERARTPYLGSLVEEAIGITCSYLKREGNPVVSKLVQRNGRLSGGEVNYEQLFFQVLDDAQDNIEQKPRESDLVHPIETITNNSLTNTATQAGKEIKHDTKSTFSTATSDGVQQLMRQLEMPPPTALSSSFTGDSGFLDIIQSCSLPPFPATYDFQRGNAQFSHVAMLGDTPSTASPAGALNLSLDCPDLFGFNSHTFEHPARPENVRISNSLDAEFPPSLHF
ncbi:hypothetical protein B0J13DRAFT_648481 [Dactylonectria estremocensis]|uniref:C2H2-type domain-containing protein n=1 Tax=Dactylonectria estremocensis TaxID=1079267 RepID=A0A9P9DNG8_9HYPO|nr:hypothetical protein B0J13DRAFT_648481 [Dactylonectria estremocensis]